MGPTPSVADNLRELFVTASRFDNFFLKAISLIKLYFSVALIFLPFLNSDLMPSWLRLMVAGLAATNLFLAYVDVNTKPNEQFKRNLIHNLLSSLNHMYRWQGQCRITLFTLKQVKNDRYEITPYERTSVAAPAGIKGAKVCFERGYGVPGKAWASAWNGGDVNQLAECLQFGDVPRTILHDDEQLREYYIEQFNMSDATYTKLGDEKFKIASYMAIGIQRSDMTLAGVLVLDSQVPDFFIDFKSLQCARMPTMIRKSGVMVSVTAVEKPLSDSSDSDAQVPKEVSDIQKILDSITKSVVEGKDQNGLGLPDQMKKLNRMRAAQQDIECTPANVASVLSPLEWVLRSVRDMGITE